MSNFKRLVQLFARLPGVGPRQGARFVLALLERNDADLKELGQAILDLKENIQLCQECFNLTDNYVCSICNDSKRDRAKLMVVEKITDLASVEKTGLYKGLYHVLGGAISPIDGMNPEQLKFRELERRVDTVANEDQNLEIVLATNPSTAGETTALYIKDMFANKNGVTLTRLARGLASGSNLEYADELTLKHALEHRK